MLVASCLTIGCSTVDVGGYRSFVLAPSDLLNELCGEWLNIETSEDDEFLVVAPAGSFGFLDRNPTFFSKLGLSVHAPQTEFAHQGTEQLYIMNGQLIQIEGDLQTASSSAISARP